MLPKLGRPDTGRYTAVVVCVALLFAYWCGHSLLVLGQAQDPRVANRNGDVNGDGKLDLADAVYFLSWLFEGGPEPVALAQEDDVEFGKMVAGSYLGDADGITFIATLMADGTFIQTDATDFGQGDLLANGFNSPQHGAWTRTGPRETTVTHLQIAYDSNGALTGIVRISATGTWDENFEEGSGTYTFEVFAPDQDPLDPNATPVNAGEGTYTVRRIHATL